MREVCILIASEKDAEGSRPSVRFRRFEECAMKFKISSALRIGHGLEYPSADNMLLHANVMSFEYNGL